MTEPKIPQSCCSGGGPRSRLHAVLQSCSALLLSHFTNFNTNISTFNSLDTRKKINQQCRNCVKCIRIICLTLVSSSGMIVLPQSNIFDLLLILILEL